MEKDVKLEYSNGEITLVWQPGLCIHSGNCVKGLPGVFKPKERPWIKVHEAPTDAIRRTGQPMSLRGAVFIMNKEK